MENQQESSVSRGKKVFTFLVVIAAGFAICAVMKTFVCGNNGEKCSCLEHFKQVNCTE